MALPRTGLTALLCGTAEQMIAALESRGCLVPSPATVPHPAIELARSTLREHAAFRQAHPGWTGPDAADAVAKALLASPYLNPRGRRLAVAQDDIGEPRSWWRRLLGGSR